MVYAAEASGRNIDTLDRPLDDGTHLIYNEFISIILAFRSTGQRKLPQTHRRDDLGNDENLSSFHRGGIGLGTGTRSGCSLRTFPVFKKPTQLVDQLPRRFLAICDTIIS